MPRTHNGTKDTPLARAVSFEIRKASMADIPGLLALINSFAGRGILLPRTEFEMAENIRDFSVIHSGNELAGCGALHFYTPRAAEVRSLAIGPEFQGGGGGKVLMQALEVEAQAFGVQEVFAFTYIPEFFKKWGFVEIDRGALPLKAWKDCLRCPKFQCCDEVAVIKAFAADHMGVMDTRTCGITPLAYFDSTPDIKVPVLSKKH